MAKKRAVGGRPAMADEEKLILVPVRLSPDQVRLLDEVNMARPSRPGRSGLIREYVAGGLSAEIKSKERRK